MKTHLTTHNLLNYVNAELPEEADNAVKGRDSMALSQIHQAIDVSKFPKIATARTAKKAWDIWRRLIKVLIRSRRTI